MEKENFDVPSIATTNNSATSLYNY